MDAHERVRKSKATFSWEKSRFSISAEENLCEAYDAAGFDQTILSSDLETSVFSPLFQRGIRRCVRGCYTDEGLAESCPRDWTPSGSARLDVDRQQRLCGECRLVTFNLVEVIPNEPAAQTESFASCVERASETISTEPDGPHLGFSSGTNLSLAASPRDGIVIDGARARMHLRR